jgi:hypothetical protein
MVGFELGDDLLTYAVFHLCKVQRGRDWQSSVVGACFPCGKHLGSDVRVESFG